MARRAAFRACQVCRVPVTGRYRRCYQCQRHQQAAGRLLADAVVPVGYAVKGGQLASDLWRYKWDSDEAAAGRLRAMLRDFLRGHGDCVRRAAGVPDFSRVAVVPSGQGRPGPHPFEAIVASSVALPMARLSPVQAVPEHGRQVSAGWLRADATLAGERVLVIDDAWVSGGSAQSAAVALRLAGAMRVAVVVLGRYVSLASPCPAGLLAALATPAAPHDAYCTDMPLLSHALFELRAGRAITACFPCRNSGYIDGISDIRHNCAKHLPAQAYCNIIVRNGMGHQGVICFAWARLPAVR